MLNAIHINKYIKKWLQGSEKITAVVPKKNIAPLILNPTNFPIITFAHGAIEPDYSMLPEGRSFDNVEVSIVVVSDDYEQSINIMSDVRELFEFSSFKDEQITIPLISVDSITEDFQDNAYIQEMILKFEVETLKNNEN